MATGNDLSVVLAHPISSSGVVIGDPDGVHEGQYRDEVEYERGGIQPHLSFGYNWKFVDLPSEISDGSFFDKYENLKWLNGFGTAFELDIYRDSLTESSATAYPGTTATRVSDWGGGLAVLPNYTLDFSPRETDGWAFLARALAGARLSVDVWDLIEKGSHTEGIEVIPGQECVVSNQNINDSGCKTNPMWQVNGELGANAMLERRSKTTEVFDVVTEAEIDALRGLQSDFDGIYADYYESDPVGQQISEAKRLLEKAQAFLAQTEQNSYFNRETTILRQKISRLQSLISASSMPVTTGPLADRSVGEIGSSDVNSVCNDISNQMSELIDLANQAPKRQERTTTGTTRGVTIDFRYRSGAPFSGIDSDRAAFVFPEPTNPNSRRLYGEMLDPGRVMYLGAGYYQRF